MGGADWGGRGWDNGSPPGPRSATEQPVGVGTWQRHLTQPGWAQGSPLTNLFTSRYQGRGRKFAFYEAVSDPKELVRESEESGRGLRKGSR